MSKPSMTTPLAAMPFPFHHYPMTYGNAVNESFQRLLVIWNQVADILKTKPPGTMIRAGNDGFVMGVMNGELAMFISEDLLQVDSDVTSCVYSIEYLNSASVAVLDEITAALSAWMKFQAYSFEVDPTHIANVLRHAYKSESVALWKWNGNTHKANGHFEFTLDEISHLCDGLNSMITDTLNFETQGEVTETVQEYNVLLDKLESARRTFAG